jgi:phosphoglucomutase
MMAIEGKSPSRQFAELTQKVGRTYYARIDSPADKSARDRIVAIKADGIKQDLLGGEPITRKEITASGNGKKIGGIKLSTGKGWIAIRSSGTEDICKTYAESFVNEDHLSQLQADAKKVVADL